jgi:hypothetical protein
MKKKTRLVVLGFAAIAAAALARQGVESIRERQARALILEAIRPVTLRNCVLARVGSANDGGYLMCPNLIEPPVAAYSYGVGANDEWGCAISTRYRIPVHQYDCYDPTRPVCETGEFVFHNECVAERRETSDAQVFDTLANQIERNGDTGTRLIVKIDVEGAEWDALLATPDDVLARVDQLPMELHLPKGAFGADRATFLSAIEKLTRTFYVVNLHFNNNTCAPEAEPLPGWVFQVLLVNKRVGEVDRTNGPATPSPLNAPDAPGKPECQSWAADAQPARMPR